MNLLNACSAIWVSIRKLDDEAEYFYSMGLRVQEAKAMWATRLQPAAVRSRVPVALVEPLYVMRLMLEGWK